MKQSSVHMKLIKNSRNLRDEVVVWLKRTLHLKHVDPEKFIARIEALNKEVALPLLADDFLKQAKRSVNKQDDSNP